MPALWLVGPDGQRVEFEEAPEWFDSRGLMPAAAVKAILRNIGGSPSFHVRPSDVVPTMLCRRKRVWETTHAYGVNPFEEESLVEGSAFHEYLDTEEIAVPPAVPLLDDTFLYPRAEVCGVPMRGYIDDLNDLEIIDYKHVTPFWASKYAPKGSADRWPITYVWSKPDRDKEDVAKWQLQLSLYRALLKASGHSPLPDYGVIWRRLAGVKATELAIDGKLARWRKFTFPLLSESQLETQVGPWMRELQRGLTEAETNPEAWASVPADGQTFVGSKGNLWACDRCPLKTECYKQDGLEVF